MNVQLKFFEHLKNTIEASYRRIPTLRNLNLCGDETIKNKKDY